MSDSDEMEDVRAAILGGAPASAPARTGRTETGDAVPLDELPETEWYEAYKLGRDPFCLSVYTDGPADAHPAWHHYNYLLNERGGKIFDIVYDFFVVRVRGRNLLPVVLAIKSKRCVFIQQYQRRAHWREPGKNDPLIEKIEITYKPSERTAMLEKGVPA